ncbi:MAG TPA: hypothetical protein VHL34_21705 [Rhizomicrobium sp.]|jgi:hypothetical protein|nr:hypothetical protein [Rhizomicrobium sp.]
MELPLEAWHDFYLTIGAGAAAVLGATFVVATLSANIPQRTIGLKGFITPTAVHLGSVLVGSVILLMPTLDIVQATLIFLIGGVAGAIYCVVIWTRIHPMNIDLIDRFWYAAFPTLCYAALAAGGILVWRADDFAFELFGLAFVALTITGVRNAWDMATFMVMFEEGKPPPPKD